MITSSSLRFAKSLIDCVSLAWDYLLHRCVSQKDQLTVHSCQVGTSSSLRLAKKIDCTFLARDYLLLFPFIRENKNKKYALTLEFVNSELV